MDTITHTFSSKPYLVDTFETFLLNVCVIVRTRLKLKAFLSNNFITWLIDSIVPSGSLAHTVS